MITRIEFYIQFIFDEAQSLCLEVKAKWNNEPINLALSSLSMFLFSHENDLHPDDVDLCYSLGKFIKKITLGSKFYLAIPHDDDIADFFKKVTERDILLYWKKEDAITEIQTNTTLPFHINVEKKGPVLQCSLRKKEICAPPFDWLSFYGEQNHIIFSNGIILTNPPQELDDFINDLQLKEKITYRDGEIITFVESVYSPLKEFLHWNLKTDLTQLLPQRTKPSPLLTLTYEDNMLNPTLNFQYENTLISTDCEDSVIHSKDGKIYERDHDQEHFHQKHLMDQFHAKDLPFMLKSPGDIGRFMNEIVPILLEKKWMVNSNVPEFKIHKEPVTIEFNIHSSKTDWFHFDQSMELHGQNFSLQEIAKVMVSNQGYVKTKKGYVKLSKSSQDELKILTKMGALKVGKQFSKTEILPLITVSNASSTNNTCKTLIDNIKHIHKIPTPPLNKTFLGSLRDYQHYGVNWLYFLKTVGMGAILADDMGLGKTVQTLAFSTYLSGPAPILIIGPTNVVFNWKDEINKFLPSAKLALYTGQGREKIRASFEDYNFIITSFGVVKNDIDFLKQIQFKAIFIDEAQYIKNAQTQSSKAVKELNSNFRIAMTGTPIENHLQDLWSIVEFVMPSYLGTKSQFDNLIKNENFELIKTKIQPFILRREKREVLDSLPEKTEVILKCPLGDKQKQLYQTVLQTAKKGIKSSTGKNEKLNILTALLKLRQICIHPGLLPELNGTNYESTKFELVKEKLSELIEEGHKVVLFSQFTKMLDIIQEWTQKQHISCYRIDGSVSGKNRQAKIKLFQESEEASVFIISLKAGGVGINLTSADYVIHLDPWWNPAVESQATDRVHRLGQKNKVIVYKLYTENTIEEKIQELQTQKQNLLSHIIDIDHIQNQKINLDDLKKLIFDL